MSLVDNNKCVQVVETSAFTLNNLLMYYGYESWDDSREAQIARLFNEASAQLHLLEDTEQPASERWHFDPIKLAELLNKSGEGLRDKSCAKVVTPNNLSELKFLVSEALRRYSSEGEELVILFGNALYKELQVKEKIERAVEKSKTATSRDLEKINQKVAGRAAKALEKLNGAQKINQQSAETMLSLNQMKLEFLHSLNILRIALIAHPLYHENGLDINCNFKDSVQRLEYQIKHIEEKIVDQLSGNFVAAVYDAVVSESDTDTDSDSDEVSETRKASSSTANVNDDTDEVGEADKDNASDTDKSEEGVVSRSKADAQVESDNNDMIAKTDEDFYEDIGSEDDSKATSCMSFLNFE